MDQIALPLFLSSILSLSLSFLPLPPSICLGWRFVLIRGLCWLALLSLAVQKGTNWQWADESPLSPSCAQLPPPLTSLAGPSCLYLCCSCSYLFIHQILYSAFFSLPPNLLFLSYVFSPFTFPVWAISCSFFLYRSDWLSYSLPSHSSSHRLWV